VTASYELIRYTVSDGVANIELNRPEALNAFSPQMGGECLDALSRVRADPEVRAVTLTAAGRAFCAGGDFSGVRPLNAQGHPDVSRNLLKLYNPLVLELRSLPKPVVAAVQGACAGIGVSFALACDLILAADNAFFLLAFVKLGLSLDGGTSSFLTERIGLARAAECAMLGDRVPAAKASEWGLINSVHPLEELPKAASDLAARLAQGPTAAIGNIKRLLTAAAQRDLAAQLQLEAEIQQSNATSLDYAEGTAAFREKRTARFVGH
jgi:2-(1,2-epoxy-1,2-dihydrophenyl)acetyl-CoA isomerase